MPFQSDRQPALPQRLPYTSVGGQLIAEAPANFLTRNARALASITITITGTVADDDQLRVEVNFPAFAGGKISKTVTAASDTTATLAQKIAKALNDDAILRSYGCFANSLANVVTFYWPGPVGNNITLAQAVPVGAETITLGNTGKMAGGSGPVIPFNTFRFSHQGQLFQFQANTPKIVGTNVVAALVLNKAAIQ